MERLKGKVALVTGGAQGIGRAAAAVALAREGADIIFCDIAEQIKTVPYPMGTPEKMAETERLVKAEGRKCLAVKADVRDMAQMRALAERGIRELGKLDIIVPNAGIGPMVPMSQMTDDVWRDTIDVNLTGVANIIRAAMPHLMERKAGRIIIVSSVGAQMGAPQNPNYIASKWGTLGLMKSVALEMGQYGVTVNAVTPTAVDTPMIRNEGWYRAIAGSFSGDSAEDEARKALTGGHALGVPWVQPEDIADAIVFLASDEAKFISGATIDVQAGSTARNMT